MILHRRFFAFSFIVVFSFAVNIFLAQNKTIDSLKQVLIHLKEDSNKVFTLYELSKKYKEAGDTMSALSFLEQRKTLAERMGFKKGTADALHEMGVIYEGQGKHEKALECCFPSLKLKEEIGDKESMDITINEIAHVYLQQSNYSGAISYFLRSVELRKGLGNKKSEAASLTTVGNVYILEDNYPKALEYHFLALKLRQKVGDKEGIAISFHQAGRAYFLQGDYPKSLEYYLKSLKIQEELGDKRAFAKTLNRIGNIYEKQADYSKALEYYFRSLKINQEIGDGMSSDNSLNYNNIGGVYNTQGNYPEALKYYLKALEIREKERNKRRVAITLLNIGEVYYQLNDPTNALSFSLKSLELNTAVGEKLGIANSLRVLGDIYEKQKKYSIALEYAQKGLSAAKETGALDVIKDANKSLSRIYEQTGNGSKALEHYKDYILFRDSVYNESNTKQMLRSEMNFEFEKKEAIAAEELNKQKILRNSFVFGLLVVLLFTWLLYNRYSVKQKLNAELNEKNKVIETQKEKIIDSITYAQNIQQSILPEEQEIIKLLPDSFIYYQPKDIVSGDFYWMSSVNGKAIIAAVDCTGHGVPGAFMSMIGNTLLNQIVNEKKVTTPADILLQLHEGVCASLRQKNKRGQSQDGMDLAICVIDNQTGKIEFAGAKNSLYVLQNNAIEEFKGDKYSVGGDELLKKQKDKERKYTNYSISVKKGASLYLFTDGYTDQFGGEERKKFGSQQFKTLLLSNHQLAMREQKTVIDEAFSKWKGGNAQIDDVLVIGLKI